MRPEPPNPAARALLVLGMLAAIVLVVGGGLFLAASISLAVSDASDRAGYIVLGVISAAVVAGAIYWAHHIEHSARRHTAIAHAYRHPHAAGRRRGTPPRAYSPLAGAVAVLVYLGFTAGFIGGTIAQIDATARSSETQHHGIRATGIVVDSKNHEDCGRSGCSHSSKIRVRFSHPVAGVEQTTAHYPHVSPTDDGASLTVLVDPHQPSYAEIPGVKLHDSGAWIPLLLGAIAFLGLGLTYLRHMFRLGRFRRAHVEATRDGGAGSGHGGTKTVF